MLYCTSKVCVPRRLEELLREGVASGLSSTPTVTGSTMERAVSSSFSKLQENISRLSMEQWRVHGEEEVEGERKFSTSVPLSTTAFEEGDVRSSTITKSVSVTLRLTRTSRSGYKRQKVIVHTCVLGYNVWSDLTICSCCCVYLLFQWSLSYHRLHQHTDVSLLFLLLYVSTPHLLQDRLTITHTIPQQHLPSSSFSSLCSSPKLLHAYDSPAVPTSSVCLLPQDHFVTTTLTMWALVPQVLISHSHASSHSPLISVDINTLISRWGDLSQWWLLTSPLKVIDTRYFVGQIHERCISCSGSCTCTTATTGWTLCKQCVPEVHSSSCTLMSYKPLYSRSSLLMGLLRSRPRSAQPVPDRIWPTTRAQKVCWMTKCLRKETKRMRVAWEMSRVRKKRKMVSVVVV